MMKFRAIDLEKMTGGELVSGRGDTPVKGLSTDSRRISPGEFFIAVRGRTFDGHDFIDEAMDNGAAGIVSEKEVSGTMGNVPVIAVEDSRTAMGRIAYRIRRLVDIPVICVTGTNGKTTVKDILSHVLSARYKVLSSEASYNNIIGMSLTFFRMDGTYDIAVLEAGTNHPGEIAALGDIAAPHIGIITNIGDGHLEHFFDRQGVFFEKVSILKHLVPPGAAFLNKDDCLLARCSGFGVDRKFFGCSDGSEYRISGIRKEGVGYDFAVNGDRFHIPLEGEHNVHNAAAAIAVAQFMGMRPEDIRSALDTVRLPGMRLERVNAGGVEFINDAYNANPDSFEAALSVLRESQGCDTRGVVAGEMMELGRWSAEFHRVIGRSIARKGIDFLVVMGEHGGDMAAAALKAGMPEEDVYSVSDHAQAAAVVARLKKGKTLVLLKGSRASGMERILKCFTTFCTL